MKVPWERVFVHRDIEMCRAQFHGTPAHVYQNYQAQIRLSVKIRFLLGLARRITEAIGTTNMPPVREKLGCSRRRPAWSMPCWPAWRQTARMRGEYYVPNKHFMYSAQVLTQDLYPRVINILRELAGGALIMLPSSIDGFRQPAARGDHRQDAALADGAGRQGEIPQGRLGRGRLGVRLAPHAIRDVLCRRALCHRRPQLPHLRLGWRDRHGRRADEQLPARGRARAVAECAALPRERPSITTETGLPDRARNDLLRCLRLEGRLHHGLAERRLAGRGVDVEPRLEHGAERAITVATATR